MTVSTKEIERRKNSHIKLVNGVLNSKLGKYRFCVKYGIQVHIKDLVGGKFECWTCNYHVAYGTDIYAECDPI